MDPFRLYVAFGPVAVYLLLLGFVNLGRRPLLVSGARDAAALALAVSGLVIVGPIELFFPFEAAVKFGTVVWVLLLGLYFLCVLLWLLSLRPRLIVYNISIDKLRPVLAEVVQQLDVDAHWAGDGLVLHDLGVQLYIDAFAPLLTVSLISASGRQSRAGWRRLEVALDAALATETRTRNPRGLTMVTAGALGLFFIVLAIAQNSEAAARSLLTIIQAAMKMIGM
jgi:hypothetical protein